MPDLSLTRFVVEKVSSDYQLSPTQVWGCWYIKIHTQRTWLEVKAYRAFGVRKTPRINKIKLDLDSGLERPTAIYWLSTNQTQSRQNLYRIRRESHQTKTSPPGRKANHTKQTKTNLSHNRADFRIEKQKRKRKARSSMRIPKVR